MTNLKTIDDKVLNDYLETLWIAKTLPVEQKKMFLQIAKANNLNPFKREIYAVAYTNYKTKETTLSIITWYQTYIARANATWKLNWWKVESVVRDWKLAWAKIIIKRKDWDEPFEWEVRLWDFKKESKVWKDMPDFMIKKVAIAQWFRLAFPEELDWLPYTKEEMEWVQPVEQEAITIPENDKQVETTKQEKTTGQSQEFPKEDLDKLKNFTKKTETEKVEEVKEKVKWDWKEENISTSQISKIKILMNEIAKKLWIEEDKEKKAGKYKEYLNMVNEKVSSSKELTKWEWSEFIKLLEKELELLEQSTDDDVIPF